MAKVLTSIVAENLSQIVKQHHLLPKTHFGGDEQPWSLGPEKRKVHTDEPTCRGIDKGVDIVVDTDRR